MISGILLDASWRILVPAVTVAVGLRLLRVRSAAARHAAWSAVLAAMVLMPVLRYVVPRVSIEVPTLVVPSPGGIAPIPKPPSPPAIADVPASVPLPPLSRPAPFSQPVWPRIWSILYIAGVVFMLVRAFAGWRCARRIAGGATRIATLPAPVYESDRIVTPVTVGAIAPRVILPTGWRIWPREKLDIVLAHELEHARRREPLINLAAHLNRSIFWFHPLAWWIERELAITAEHACDDVGVQTIDEAPKYAAILIELAETARRSGGRLSLHGPGIEGTGLLGERIDRILRGGPPRPLNRTRKAAIALSCAAAIFFAAACRRALVAELEDDPQIAASQAHSRTRQQFVESAAAMSAGQARELEAALQRNPQDVDARRKLLIFSTRSGAQKIGADAATVGRRAQILWLIRNRPEDDVLRSWDGLISPVALGDLPDPAGYAEAKKLWLAQAARPDANVQVLRVAANFLKVADKPLAEQILLRIPALDPKSSPAGLLSHLYYEALVGSNALMTLGVVRSVSLTQAHGDYANQVRKKLAETSDAALLASVGANLMQSGRELYRRGAIDFDPVALGQSYIDRALQLDPDQVTARRFRLRERMIQERSFSFRPGQSLEEQYREVSALPEYERFRQLDYRAEQPQTCAAISQRSALRRGHLPVEHGTRDGCPACRRSRSGRPVYARCFEGARLRGGELLASISDAQTPWHPVEVWRARIGD